MDLHTGVVPGDNAVRAGSIKRLVEETLTSPQSVCPKGISDGQEDGCNCCGFL